MICRKWGVWKACAKTVAQDKQPHCGGPRRGRWGWSWHPLGGWLVSSLNKSWYGGLSGDSLIFSLYENSVHWWDKCVGVSSHYTMCNTIMPMSLTAFVQTSGLSKRWWPGEGWFCTGDLWREDRLKFCVSRGCALSGWLSMQVIPMMWVNIHNSVWITSLCTSVVFMACCSSLPKGWAATIASLSDEQSHERWKLTTGIICWTLQSKGTFCFWILSLWSSLCLRSFVAHWCGWNCLSSMGSTCARRCGFMVLFLLHYWCFSIIWYVWFLL